MAVLLFEILPPGVGPVLNDGCSIGLSKEALVQSFVIARQIFFSLGEAGKIHQDEEQKDIASQVLLFLFDCEHLTAANYRKRCLAATLRPRFQYGFARWP